MSSESSKVKTSGTRTRSLAGARRQTARSATLRRLALDSLEPRTLLATIPTTTFSPTTIDISNTGGNQSAPSITVDKSNPQNLAAVWTRNDPQLAPGPTEVVEFGYSTNGGKTWQTINGGRPGNFIGDPTATNGAILPQATDASVAFDRNDNFYILYSQHKTDNSVGALLLSKYNLSGGSPTTVYTNKVVYEWVGADAASYPTLAVDDNIASFSDVNSSGVTRTQNDVFSGNVYVAWSTNDAAPAFNPGGFNPNRIVLMASSDGGNSFSPETPLSAGGNFTNARNVTPRIAVSQGSAPRAAGTNGPNDQGSPGVAPGQVTVVWDDYGTFSKASPPLDQIIAAPVTGGYNAGFTSTGGPITDAVKGAGATDTSVTSSFPINVNITDPRFISVSNVSVSLALSDPSLAVMKIVLVPPTGSGLQPITLVNNQNDASNTANAFTGISGNALGIAASGAAIGTTFNDNAPRNIVDFTNAPPARGAAAPFIGEFQPEAANSGQTLNSTYDGATTSAVNGTWTLQITVFRNGNAGNLRFWSLNLTSNLVPGNNSTITTTYDRAIASGGQIASAATSTGIAPTPVIASDNTLGAYSPYEGRIYVAYVDRIHIPTNPADNTDIFMDYSDDGGATWIPSGQTSSFFFGGEGTPVNDDNAVTDGFSEGSSGAGTGGAAANSKEGDNTGRPQFEPSIAVDQANGTVVMSWLDTRNDPSRARVSTYVTTSIDGGATFSPDIFANNQQTATDAITGKTVILGPVPDNQAVTGGGYGASQGLAVYNGLVYPAWASNLNGGNNPGPPLLFNIRTNIGSYTTGPRIIVATQGPIGEPTDTVNTQRAADGTPEASAFVVTFDRFVDPSSFQPKDVLVYYRDTTPSTTANPNGVTSGYVPVTSVVPLNAGAMGATRFQVNFAPRTGVGTYSLEVTSAEISDRIRSISSAITPTAAPSTFTTTQVPQAITPGSFAIANVTVPPSAFAAGSLIDNLTVTLSITAPDASSLFIYLIAPSGNFVLLAQQEPTPNAGGQDFGGASGTTTFDDAAATSIDSGNGPFIGTFRPHDPAGLKQLVGQSPTGTWSLEVFSQGTLTTATLNSFKVNITPGKFTTKVNSGNLLDQNASNPNSTPGSATDYFAAPQPLNDAPFLGAAVPNLNVPYNQNTLPLILPGPHILSTSIPGQPATSNNLVLNSGVSSIDVKFDRDMNPASIIPASVALLMGPAGAITGPFTITPNPTGSDPDPSHPRTYRIGFPTQTLSGTYTLTLASNITDEHGNALDSNLNAGVDLLRSTVSGATSAVTYTAPAGSLPIVSGKTAIASINVPDNFLVQGLTVSLNITYPNDPDLQITLVSPGDVPIVLVARGTGTTGTRANFSTTFSDSASTPISNGGPPFFGLFQPKTPLSVLNGTSATGTWKLFVDDTTPTPNGNIGSLTSFSLSFQKGSPSSGLGETVADQGHASFQIFTMDPTNRQSSNTWTAVGPASVIGNNTTATNNGYAGSVGAVALDPSDPSGNTVYVAGASGGVWKTTNFLTTNPNGPTYIPLTDYGPTSGLNIGSIAVFGRNHDPRQSIIIAGTGFGSVAGSLGGNTNRGVGFIISKDGGKTWSLLASSNNNLPAASQDDVFVGTATNKVVVDPNPTPSGGVIIYAAMRANSTTNGGGLWRSVDTGQTWQKMSSASLGDATDVILDYQSATANAFSNPTGNVNTIYAAFPGSGVYISPNRGQVLNLMAGGNVDPLIFEVKGGATLNQVPVLNGGNAPTGVTGARIVLARPTPLPSTAPNADVENTLYESWLYAAATDGSGNLLGVYLTKDNGQTWTKLKLSTLPPNGLVPVRAVPTNDQTQGDYNLVSSPLFGPGYYNLSLAVDPTNPNISYLGGTADGNVTGLIRIDATAVYDSHAAVDFNGGYSEGGKLQIATTGRGTVDDINFGRIGFLGTSGSGTFTPIPYLNLLQDPTNPFQTDSTLFVNNIKNFVNDGSGVKWTPIDQILQSNANDTVPSSNVHQILTIIDPVTGQARLIVADDEGVFTGVLNPDGTIDAGIGNAVSPTYSRNGNLQIAQLNYGASQPSTSPLTGQLNALFYGNGPSLGQVSSNPGILNTNNTPITVGGTTIPAGGNTVGQGSTTGATLGVIATTSGDQAGVGVGVDQQGQNIVYRYLEPGFGGNATDFFQVSVNGGPFISRTTGLVQQANDPQWPSISPLYPSIFSITGQPSAGNRAIAFGNFTVNPINGNQVMIGSSSGRVFATSNQGQSWLSIADPSSLDGTYADALTFGAPDPKGPGGIGNLNNFLYAGTVGGSIYVTQTGGGGTGNAWTNISTGLDGSPVVKIVADPTRGSHDAYAVTQQGVYYIADSTSGVAWTNITNKLFSLTNNPFGNTANPQQALTYITSLVADWRYTIPNPPNPKNPTANPGTHPVLYVGGNGGVFRSIDNGVTWTPFPNVALDGAPVDGGYLPNVAVTDLDASLGKIDPTTGFAVATATDPNVLLATTYGRGQFAIHLAPLVFPTSLALDAKLPAPSGSSNSTDPATGLPLVTVSQPVIDGLSEQSAFGNAVYITLLDETDPNNPVIIGGYDPSNSLTQVAGNQTNSSGNFQVQVNAAAFTTNGTKTIGVQATDATGAVSNLATIKFVLNAKLGSLSAPAAPTIGLNPLDDTSGGKNITANTSPRIIGSTDPNATVQVFLADTNGIPINPPNGTLLGTVVADANGNYSVQFPTSPDATYTVYAVATNSFGSTKGALFNFTIKTSPSSIVPTLSLNPADDTGIVGDNITAARKPRFIGVSDPLATVSLYQVVNNTIPPGSQPLVSGTADSTGHFSIALPFNLTDGTITLEAQESDAAGNLDPNFSTAVTVKIVSVLGDYTGTAKTSFGIFRRASNGAGVWFIQGYSPATGNVFGSANLDIPFTGDFDGSGIASLAYYRPSTNTWTINRAKLGLESFTLGGPGSVPTVLNYDGTGLSDPAVYNPTTGIWTIVSGITGTTTQTMNGISGFVPQAGDQPVPGDYTGSGQDELAIYRQSTGQFFVRVPNTGSDKATNPFVVTAISLSTGTAGDVPVPGNYDDSINYHQTEAAVFNPTTGVYMILGPNNTPRTVQLQPGDIPAPGDYNGKGQTQVAVYRPSIASFVIPGNTQVVNQLGSTGDIPITSPLVYRSIVTNAPTLVLDPASDTGLAGDNTTSARRPFFDGVTDPNALVDLINPVNGGVFATGKADATGKFRIQISPNADLPNGSYTIEARAHGVVNNQGPVSPAVTVKLVTVDGDYLGIGKTQPSFVRPTDPTSLQWYVQGSSTLLAHVFGVTSTDIPLSGDFTGSGKTSLALFRPSSGTWFIQTAATGYGGQVLLSGFGGPGDIPVPGDYFGSGRSTPAFYRPSTGEFFVYGFPTSTIVIPGRAGDVPVPGNYDNTGKTEFAIYRPSTGQWIINGPTGSYTIAFGGSGYVPVPGNYDNTAASQKTEPGLWNPTTGQYLIHGPAGNRVLQFAVGDIPAPGDYDGIGITEAAVYRPSTAQFLVMGPNDQTPRVVAAFGGLKDIPTTAPLAYRLAPSTGNTISSKAVTTITAASLNFGSSAAALTTTTPASTPTTPVTTRVRPKQLAAEARRVERSLIAAALREHLAAKRAHKHA